VFLSVACQVSPFGEFSWVIFSNRKDAGTMEDELPSTHPIECVVEDTDTCMTNFDGITYAKGASTLKQLVALVGLSCFVVFSVFVPHSTLTTTNRS
jgi:aminopeptidase N